MTKKVTLIITALICCILLVSTSYAITEEKTNSNVTNKFDDYINLTVEEVWELLNDTSNGIQIPVDVRTDSEWETEHIDTPKPENPKHHLYTDWYDEVLKNSTPYQETNFTISGGELTTKYLVVGNFLNSHRYATGF